MTNEEAYKLLTNRQKCRETDCQSGECYGCECQWDASQEDEAEAVAIEALEKQIPKKPLKREIAGVDAHLCECGEVIYPSEYFCAYCGQAIDWSEDENTL